MSADDGAASAQDPKNLPVEFQFDSTPVRMIANHHNQRVRPVCLDLHQPQARGKTLPKVGDEPGSARDPPNRPVRQLFGQRPRSGHRLVEATSASDPPTSSPTGSIPPISTQAPSTRPTNAHNHRVLCYTVTGLASCWEGLHAQDFDPVGRAANGQRDDSPDNFRSPTCSSSSSSKPTRSRRSLSNASNTS